MPRTIRVNKKLRGWEHSCWKPPPHPIRSRFPLNISFRLARLTSRGVWSVSPLLSSIRCHTSWIPPKLTQIAIPPTHHIWRRDSSQGSSKPKRREVQLRKYRTHSPNLRNLAGSDWGMSQAGNRAGKTQPCKWERISLNGCQWPLGTWMWTQHQIRKEELRFPLSSPVMSNLSTINDIVWWLINDILTRTYPQSLWQDVPLVKKQLSKFTLPETIRRQPA